MAFIGNESSEINAAMTMERHKNRIPFFIFKPDRD